MRAEGDQQKADYLFNCSYFEYFWRLKGYNEYAKEMEKRMKEKKPQT